MYAKNRLRSLGLALLLLACTAGMLLYRIGIWLPILSGIGFVLLNIFPSVWTAARRPPRRASCVASDGADLLTAFLFLIGLQVIGLIGLAVCRSSGLFSPGWLAPAVFLAADTLVFWNGILRVYLTSPIIGLKWRILGIVCGWIPVANLVVLCRIIRLVRFDTEAERQRAARDLARAADRVCATRYPLLLVHGVFFRDSNRLNYWGRIPEELERNGAVLYYGNQQSALSVADSGRELAERIRTIVRETGGLKDSIRDCGDEGGFGFTFKTYNAGDMLGAVDRALGAYANPAFFAELRQRCMAEDFSWGRSANEYIRLYRSLLKES